jgi:hypothetical protein
MGSFADGANNTGVLSMSEEMKINLSCRAAETIEKLAERSGYSPAELVSLGLATVRMVIDAQEQGHVIVEMTREGKKLSKIRFPEPRSTILDAASSDYLSEPCSLSLQRAIADLDPDNKTAPGRPWSLRPGDFPSNAPTGGG